MDLGALSIVSRLGGQSTPLQLSASWPCLAAPASPNSLIFSLFFSCYEQRLSLFDSRYTRSSFRPSPPCLTALNPTPFSSSRRQRQAWACCDRPTSCSRCLQFSSSRCRLGCRSCHWIDHRRRGRCSRRLWSKSRGRPPLRSRRSWRTSP